MHINNTNGYFNMYLIKGCQHLGNFPRGGGANFFMWVDRQRFTKELQKTKKGTQMIGKNPQKQKGHPNHWKEPQNTKRAPKSLERYLKTNLLKTSGEQGAVNTHE